MVADPEEVLAKVAWSLRAIPLVPRGEALMGKTTQASTLEVLPVHRPSLGKVPSLECPFLRK